MNIGNVKKEIWSHHFPVHRIKWGPKSGEDSRRVAHYEWETSRRILHGSTDFHVTRRYGESRPTLYCYDRDSRGNRKYSWRKYVLIKREWGKKKEWGRERGSVYLEQNNKRRRERLKRKWERKWATQRYSVNKTHRKPRSASRAKHT